MTLRLCLMLGSALLLAGCQGEAKRESGGKAEGEILPASVSDAMLPYDTVRSQAPLAPKVSDNHGGEGKGEDKGTESQDKAAEAIDQANESEPPAEAGESGE